MLRNILDPRIKIALMPSNGAIVLEATADQMALARRLINELDHPKKAYRLTYVLTEFDAGKRVGEQSYSMVAVEGQRTMMKQGSRVPLVTNDPKQSSSMVVYIDVGMNFDATVVPFGSGLALKTKVEQSSVAEEHSGLGPQDPVVRQTMYEGTSQLALGKGLTIGSLNITGSTRRVEISVTAEAAQ
jgi:hypothetical protein